MCDSFYLGKSAEVQVEPEFRFKINLWAAYDDGDISCKPRRLGYIMFTQSQRDKVLAVIRSRFQQCLGPNRKFHLRATDSQKHLEEPEDLLVRPPSELGERPSYVTDVTAWLCKFPGRRGGWSIHTFCTWLWCTSMFCVLLFGTAAGVVTDGKPRFVLLGMVAGFGVVMFGGMVADILIAINAPNPLDDIEIPASMNKHQIGIDD